MVAEGHRSQFYSEEIETHFETELVIEKRTGLPEAFTWRGRRYRVVELLKEWHDYLPRGKTKSMYEKEKGSYWVKAGKRHGSWGVGRDYYRVRTDTDEVFDIYYDRKPKGQKSKGGWWLWRRVGEEEMNE